MIAKQKTCCRSSFRAAAYAALLISLTGAWTNPLRGQSNDRLEFSEEIIAGGPDEFMIARHLRLKGSNRMIGRKLAEIARTQHGTKPPEADPDILRARWEYYKQHYPNHYERSLGVAEFYAMTPSTPNETMSLMYNLDVLPGCSVVYYPPASTDCTHGILSRNYDLTVGSFAEMIGMKAPAESRPMNADPYILEVYPDKGYPSLYISSNSLLGGCMDGINSKGLCVALLANHDVLLPPPAKGLQAGFSEIEICRFLLDTCANTEEAKAALRQIKHYYCFVPCHYIIGDRQGQSFIWEYSGDGNQLHFLDGEKGPQVITNHPLHPVNGNNQAPETGSQGSVLRYRRMQKEIGKGGGRVSMDVIKKTNTCVMVPVERPKGGEIPERTLWHSIYDCQDLTLNVDFYLGDEAGTDGRMHQKRSGYRRIALQRE